MRRATDFSRQAGGSSLHAHDAGGGAAGREASVVFVAVREVRDGGKSGAGEEGGGGDEDHVNPKCGELASGVDSVQAVQHPGPVQEPAGCEAGGRAEVGDSVGRADADEGAGEGECGD